MIPGTVNIPWGTLNISKSDPAHKILWYRGGMQDWESRGLTTLKPAGN